MTIFWFSVFYCSILLWVLTSDLKQRITSLRWYCKQNLLQFKRGLSHLQQVESQNTIPSKKYTFIPWRRQLSKLETGLISGLKTSLWPLLKTKFSTGMLWSWCYGKGFWRKNLAKIERKAFFKKEFTFHSLGSRKNFASEEMPYLINLLFLLPCVTISHLSLLDLCRITTCFY